MPYVIIFACNTRAVLRPTSLWSRIVVSSNVGAKAPKADFPSDLSLCGVERCGTCWGKGIVQSHISFRWWTDESQKESFFSLAQNLELLATNDEINWLTFTSIGKGKPWWQAGSFKDSQFVANLHRLIDLWLEMAFLLSYSNIHWSSKQYNLLLLSDVLSIHPALIKKAAPYAHQTMLVLRECGRLRMQTSVNRGLNSWDWGLSNAQI